VTHRDMDPNLHHDAETNEDIEILEVVGVDENGVPIAAADPHDVEIDFEDGGPDAAAELSMASPRMADEEEQLRERMLRLLADFENFKKRIERERADHSRYATFALVGRILPVIDNLERAIAAARPGVQGDPLVEGLLLIHRQLLSELEGEGLRGMNGVGEPFDPARHEVVATDAFSPLPPHTVTQVLQRGYFLHDRVLRPAMVCVRVDPSEADAGAVDPKES